MLLRYSNADFSWLAAQLAAQLAIRYLSDEMIALRHTCMHVLPVVDLQLFQHVFFSVFSLCSLEQLEPCEMKLLSM